MVKTDGPPERTHPTASVIGCRLILSDIQCNKLGITNRNVAAVAERKTTQAENTETVIT